MEKNFKKRPALVLRSFDDKDLLVCKITSQLYQTEFDVLIESWKESGLMLPSVIRVHKMATLESETVDLTK